ncbi:MAG: hypothetical protein JWP81_582 [Ferruginibacter sp.]|nr:hypothetical protein [Ferruginibacter sp.]
MNKKIFLLAAIILLLVTISYEQVGIGTATPHPSSKLDITSTKSGLLIPRMTTAQRIIIPSPATGLQVFDTDTKSFWFWDGIGWMQISTGSTTSFWALNGSDIFNNNGGNVGIGTTTPANKFTVQTQTNQFGLTHTDGAVTIASYIGVFQGVLGGWLGTRSNHPLYFFTNNSAQQMTLLPNGNVGIGTINPTNKLQINGATPGFTDFDFAIGRNTQSMAIYQGPNFTNLVSTANISVNPKNGTGCFGINAGNPANKLQIGSLGANIFNGNDLAIGNGTAAMVIYQSDASTLLASTTDIILRPRNNGQGRVGINTTTPRAPLDVTDNVTIPTASRPYYSYHTYISYQDGIGWCYNNCSAIVSIYASNAVLANEFDAYSDARIKIVTGVSNSAKDLEIIDAIKITDYIMKDRVKYSNKPFKKVIAQEVEKVYPQVVSKHTDFVPNVYQVSSKIEKTNDGYLLTFAGKHNISKGAKKLRILMSETEGMQSYDIVSVPSDNKVIINAPSVTSVKAFVYGEEVDDFRTVDYEGLTTLNISATQELSRLIKMLQKQIEEQNKQIYLLTEIVYLMQSAPLPGIAGR